MVDFIINIKNHQIINIMYHMMKNKLLLKNKKKNHINHMLILDLILNCPLNRLRHQVNSMFNLSLEQNNNQYKQNHISKSNICFCVY